MNYEINTANPGWVGEGAVILKGAEWKGFVDKSELTFRNGNCWQRFSVLLHVILIFFMTDLVVNDSSTSWLLQWSQQCSLFQALIPFSQKMPPRSTHSAVKEAQKSHLKEQSTKARILIRYKNVPEWRTSSRNQPEIGNAALRFKPLGLTIRDFRRWSRQCLILASIAVSSEGCSGMFAISSWVGSVRCADDLGSFPSFIRFIGLWQCRGDSREAGSAKLAFGGWK